MDSPPRVVLVLAPPRPAPLVAARCAATPLLRCPRTACPRAYRAVRAEDHALQLFAPSGWECRGRRGRGWRGRGGACKQSIIFTEDQYPDNVRNAVMFMQQSPPVLANTSAAGEAPDLVVNE